MPAEPSEAPRPESLRSPETAPKYRPVERALLSVFYKDGVVELAQGLHEEGVEIVSTGGTYREITQAGIPAVEVADITKFPEMMEGRLKTLHPKVFGGILGDRSKELHLNQMAAHGIKPVDLVVVNLYPFEETVASTDDILEIIEKIDVGGPSMIRGGGKNVDSVASVCDPAMYPEIIQEIRSFGGISQELRARCMIDAFKRTAAYDAAIAEWTAEHYDELSALVKPFEPAGPKTERLTDEQARAFTRRAEGG